MESLKSLYYKKENVKEEMRNTLREVDFFECYLGLNQGDFEKCLDFEPDKQTAKIRAIKVVVKLKEEKIDFEILGTGFSIWKTIDIPKDCFSKEEPGQKLISFIDNRIEYITKNLDLSQMRDFYYGI